MCDADHAAAQTEDEDEARDPQPTSVPSAQRRGGTPQETVERAVVEPPERR